jgi:hypothetical protein
MARGGRQAVVLPILGSSMILPETAIRFSGSRSKKEKQK